MPSLIKNAIARARFHKQPVAVRFAFADHIDFLNATHWDAVTAHRGLLMGRTYLRELAQARPANLALRFAPFSGKE